MGCWRVRYRWIFSASTAWRRQVTLGLVSLDMFFYAGLQRADPALCRLRVVMNSNPKRVDKSGRYQTG